MGERDADWERAHSRVEGNGGQRCRLEEGALKDESGVGERDADWERAHLRVEGNGVGERDADWERAHLIGREVWRREMSTGRERT